MTALYPLLRRWPVVALIISAAMLAAAHAFETFGHLAPCHLCLKQREAYWAAMAVAAVGVALSLSPWRARAARLVAFALALVFAYGAGWAIYHAGAEWKFWPGPQSCSGVATRVNPADLEALLKGAKIGAAPACDKAAWVFLGLSMAGWNALVSLGLCGLSVLAGLRKETA